MKLLTILALVLACSSAFALPRTSSYRTPTYHAPRSTAVPVRAHITKSGTYVAPSYRTSPNHTKTDNWSSKPNVNPYTGRAGTKNPYAVPSYGH